MWQTLNSDDANKTTIISNCIFFEKTSYLKNCTRLSLSVNSRIVLLDLMQSNKLTDRYCPPGAFLSLRHLLSKSACSAREPIELSRRSNSSFQSIKNLSFPSPNFVLINIKNNTRVNNLGQDSINFITNGFLGLLSN